MQFLFLTGIGILFSAITTFVRDFGIVLPNLLMILLFSTPIFYPLDAVPFMIRWIEVFNPIYIISEAYRAVILDHHAPEILPILLLGIIAWVLLAYNLAIFRRVKGFFPSIV